MRIVIKKLDSQKEPFDMDEKDTVRQLKEMLAEKSGIDKEQIRLILKGQPLLDDKVYLVHDVVLDYSCTE